jgi:hypothetical protein
MLALAACASPASDARGPSQAAGVVSGPPLRPSEIHHAAVFVRLEIEASGFDEKSRASLIDEYDGALLEALDARAILTRDVRIVRAGERFDERGGIARAREVGADHAIIVEVRVVTSQIDFCRETRRPFRSATTLWNQGVEVIRTSDGAVRLAIPRPGIQVGDLDPDCDDPRSSERRSRADTIDRAVGQLLLRVFGQ